MPHLIAFSIPLHHKIAPIFIFTFILSWVFSGKAVQLIENKRRRGLLLIVIGYFLFNLISVLYSDNQLYGVNKITTQLSLFFLPVVFYSLYGNISYKRILQILFAFILGNVLASIICLSHAVYQYIVNNQNYFFYYKLSLFRHTSYFAAYLSFCVAVAYYFLSIKIISKHKNIKRLIVFFVIFFSGMIYLLSSKAGIFSIIIVHSLGILYLINKQKPIRRPMPVIISVILIAFFSAFALKYNYRLNAIKNELIVPVKNKDDSGSTRVRLLIWESAMDLINNKNVFTGFGIGDVRENLVKKYKEDGITVAYKKQLNAHNQFIEILLSTGIINLLIFFLIFFIPFYNGLRNLEFLIPVFLVIVYFNYLFESFLNAQAGTIFVGFFYGLLVFAKPIKRRNTKLFNKKSK